MAAAVGLLAGCGSDGLDPVAVAPPTAPSPEAAVACARLAELKPETIDSEPARPAAPESVLTAAWGEPAVLLRCGVDRPASLTSTSFLSTVNGIDWLPEEEPGRRVFTSVGRVAFVEVIIPEGHEPQVGPLVDLAAAVTEAVPPAPDPGI